MIGDAEVPELQCKANEMRDEVRRVDSAVDENCAVDVRMMCWRVNRGLRFESVCTSLLTRSRWTYLHRHKLVVNAANKSDPSTIL